MVWVRWTLTLLFLVALLGIAVAAAYGALVMSRVLIHLKKEEAARETSDYLTMSLLRETMKRPVVPPHDDDPPVTMGVDFGLGQLWFAMKRRWRDVS